MSGVHFHLCKSCWSTWHHDVPDEHLCPVCGSGPYYWKHKSVREAEFVKKALREFEYSDHGRLNGEPWWRTLLWRMFGV